MGLASTVTDLIFTDFANRSYSHRVSVFEKYLYLHVVVIMQNSNSKFQVNACSYSLRMSMQSSPKFKVLYCVSINTTVTRLIFTDFANRSYSHRVSIFAAILSGWACKVSPKFNPSHARGGGLSQFESCFS